MDASQNTTRRKFLKSTAALAGGALASKLTTGEVTYAGGSDIIRVGMIGCGGRNTGAAVQALSADPGARLVAMCDIFMDRVKGKRQTLKDQKKDQVTVDDDHCFAGFDGYKHVIEASDVVVIANAAKFHPLHSMTAIKAGKHVFVEKPHGIDPAGLKLMQQTADLAKQKGLSLVSGLQSRYHSGYAETVQRIHDGAIGDVVAIEENFLRGPYGVIKRKEGLTELQWQCSTQYHFRWLSGDDVVQSLVHNLDRTSWAMENKAPAKCHGLGGRSSMTEPIYGDVFDHHSVVYEYANGARVYAFCRTTNGCYNNSSSVVLGSKGKASITGCRIWGETDWRWQGRCNPYQREHDVLFKAIRSGEPVNNGDYMVRSTMITVMGQISCYTGKEVTWDQINKSDFYYPPKSEDCRDDMEPPVKPGAHGSYPVPKPGFTKMI
ncbi:MAG: Gfo/Idh/MocA family oxidoreductase [Phycisphaerae bacterium]|nr:Gfo/Idh/MocA family oxidoreductase [Phycisphaerae bacterium]NIP51245.1 Gfo/Idh/MocA family oxidoreductase [Phycisphaerae bacterium]NIS50451.1 Gfo/Idh/MocA family oxidoreductase [Phycisphaerae bacterium]NIU08186.1 Gfo/Idh/MocA family oxidoreductase [Phycisphaerae bacterium]NIU54957.1 Gfo/Idh/MocA family oxidoreductase [Phycisphaerae bacterium]